MKTLARAPIGLSGMISLSKEFQCFQDQWFVPQTHKDMYKMHSTEIPIKDLKHMLSTPYDLESQTHE